MEYREAFLNRQLAVEWQGGAYWAQVDYEGCVLSSEVVAKHERRLDRALRKVGVLRCGSRGGGLGFQLQ